MRTEKSHPVPVGTTLRTAQAASSREVFGSVQTLPGLTRSEAMDRFSQSHQEGIHVLYV